MAAQLYVKYPDTTQWILLDLYPGDAEPIKLTFSVADISDPLKVASIFSKTFRVPNTEVNGPFFRAVFNVNSTDFDASKKAEAYINDNGATFSIGNIRLNAIVRNDRTRNVEYEIIFMGEVSDFASTIAGGYMNELNLDAYNHPITYTNIVNSWSGGLFNGDIRYPLIEWGYTYNSAGVPNIPTIADGGVAGFTNSANPLKVEQFKPSPRLKILWDAIFERAGYTYTNDSFMNSALFQNLYVVLENQARATIDVSQSFFATTTGNFPRFIVQTIPATGVPARLIATTKIYDRSNLYNPNALEYNVAASGTYQFATRIIALPVGGAVQVNLILRNVVTNAILGIKYFPVTTNGTLTWTFPSVALTQGDKVALQVEVLTAAPGFPGTAVHSIQNTFYSVITPDVVNLTSLMPNNYKIQDFLKSVIDKFKLVFIPDENIPKRFQIIPWVDWIQEGRSKDWTEKLDESKDMLIKPLFQGQPRTQIYRDISDTDYVNIGVQYNFKETFGQLNLDSGNELLAGEQVREGGFAPTPLDKIGGTTNAANTWLIPHLAKDTQLTRDPIQPKPRLLFWNGLKTAPATWYLTGTGSPAPSEPQTTFPLMSSFQQWPPTLNTLDLNWENDQPVYDTITYANPEARTVSTVFSQYWGAWYNTIYDPFSRLVEANFVLDYSDIYDLKFNDYVFVKDSWYFVNKVSDYIAGMNTNCKVQLYKIGSTTGITIPLTPQNRSQVTLCRGNTICQSFCCNGEFGNANYFVDGDDMTDSNQIFSDQFGNVVAPIGFYSDGVTAWEVGTDGVILGPVSTEECVCIGPLTAFTGLCYSLVLCTACCCDGSTVTLYGANPEFYGNLTFFADSFGTVPAAAGWYKYGSEVVYIEVGGTVQFVSLCTECACEESPLFEQDLNFGANQCAACCSISAPATYWSNQAVLSESTSLWADSGGTTLPANGWYTDGSGDVVQVVSGSIVAVGTCSVCEC